MATVNSNNVPTNSSLGSALAQQNGSGQKLQGISAKAFVISLGTGMVIFAVQFILFVLIKNKLARI